MTNLNNLINLIEILNNDNSNKKVLKGNIFEALCYIILSNYYTINLDIEGIYLVKPNLLPEKYQEIIRRPNTTKRLDYGGDIFIAHSDKSYSLVQCKAHKKYKGGDSCKILDVKNIIERKGYKVKHTILMVSSVYNSDRWSNEISPQFKIDLNTLRLLDNKTLYLYEINKELRKFYTNNLKLYFENTIKYQQFRKYIPASYIYQKNTNTNPQPITTNFIGDIELNTFPNPQPITRNFIGDIDLNPRTYFKKRDTKIILGLISAFMTLFLCGMGIIICVPGLHSYFKNKYRYHLHGFIFLIFRITEITLVGVILGILLFGMEFYYIIIAILVYFIILILGHFVSLVYSIYEIIFKI